MAYRIRRKSSIEENVRRVAREQIDKAVHEILDETLDRHEAVHQVRKRCKKIRGLIRIVRPNFDSYRRENQFFRDTARQLSYIRDAQSVVECFDRVVERFAGEVDGDAFGSIRARLTEQRRRVAEDQRGLASSLDQCLTHLRTARRRIDTWTIAGDGFVAVEGGLRKTYRRGRKALRRMYEDSSSDRFHEWRKRVKYHSHHVKLLRSIWRKVINAYFEAADQLAGLLGDDHNMALLRAAVLAHPELFGGEPVVHAFVDLIDRRCGELRAEAHGLGERIFAEKPSQLAARLQHYWDIWRVGDNEQPAK